jgi:uncharacterized protein
MSSVFFTALGLMLVLEGLLPFLVPQIWRETFRKMIELKDGQLRFVGMVSMLAGLFFIFWSH